MSPVGPHVTEQAKPVAEKSWAVVTWQSGRRRGGCLSALAFLALQVHLALAWLQVLLLLAASKASTPFQTVNPTRVPWFPYCTVHIAIPVDACIIVLARISVFLFTRCWKHVCNGGQHNNLMKMSLRVTDL